MNFGMQELLVARSEPVTESGCWLWEGNVDGKGYGRLWVGHKLKKAHRLSYEVFIGEIPDGMCALHKCDVRSCINPWHLFLGTNADNTADMMRKGRNRQPKGIDHFKAKLTEEAVKFIRESTASGVELAAQLGVTTTTICYVRKRKIWRHLVS